MIFGDLLKSNCKSILILLVFLTSLSFVLAIPGNIGDSCPPSPCSPTYLTDHGTFYGYCSSSSNKCAVADGIDGNLNTLEWCQNFITALLADYSHWSHYWTGSEYIDFLGWNPGTTSCEELFYGSLPENVGDSGFRGGYNYLGQQTQIRDEDDSLVEESFYDSLGQSGSYAFTSSTSGIVKSSIDPMGRIHQSVDALGNELKNYYDGLDRITLTKHYKPSGQIDFSFEYCYDSYCDGGSCSETGNSLNLLCEIQDNSGKTKFRYDERDRTSWKEKTIYSERHEPRVYTLSFEYDLADNIEKMTLPDGASIEYKYDSLNQIIGVWHVTGGKKEKIANLDYNPSGQLNEKILNPNSVNKIDTDYYYDEKYQLIGLNYKQKNSPILQRAMEYDEVGNVKRISYNLDESNPKNILSNDESYDYDNIYRLVQAVYTGDKIFEYTYKNLIGDRETKKVDGQTTLYSYDSQRNRVSSMVSGGQITNLLYYVTGSLKSKTDTEKQIDYEYDALNRLSKTSVDGDDSEYFYDYLNNRVMKETYDTTTFYLYNGNDVIYEETYDIVRCSDETISGKCSGYDFCTNGVLVNNRCDVCGCAAGDSCKQSKRGFYCITQLMDRDFIG